MNLNKFKRNCLHKIIKLYVKTPLSMAKYAYRNTEIYKSLYNKKPKKNSDVLMLTKNEIEKSVPLDILSKKQLFKATRYAETTGSLGRPTSSFYSKFEFNNSHHLFELVPEWASIKKLSRHKSSRFAVNGITHGYTVAGHVFGHALEKAGFITAHLGSRSTIAMPSRIAETIIRLKPAVIAASVSDFICWMKIIKDKENSSYQEVLEHLHYFISSAELCSNARSKQLEKKFGLRHLNFYGSVEGFFTIPCRCSQFHVPDLFKVEVLQNNIIKTKGRGRMLFSNLGRYSSPMVRYLLDDDVSLRRVPKGKCRAGEKFHYSILPHGRNEMSVFLNNKKYGLRHFEEVIFRLALFGEYAIEIDFQDGYDILNITLEAFETFDNLKSLANKIAAYLSVTFQTPSYVEIVPMGFIRDYKEIRYGKPLWRLSDKRKSSSQRMPQFI